RPTPSASASQAQGIPASRDTPYPRHQVARANPAMTSFPPVCTEADLMLGAPTQTAVTVARRKTCAPAPATTEGDTLPTPLGDLTELTCPAARQNAWGKTHRRECR